jgi:hypothetical protein
MKRICWGKPGRADADFTGPFLRDWQDPVGGAARAADLRARPLAEGATLGAVRPLRRAEVTLWGAARLTIQPN